MTPPGAPVLSQSLRMSPGVASFFIRAAYMVITFHVPTLIVALWWKGWLLAGWLPDYSGFSLADVSVAIVFWGAVTCVSPSLPPLSGWFRTGAGVKPVANS